jgi:TPP-dependent trihydroxycyclohexane-1,2-dione (THcHDO) dehydratase
MLPIIMGELPAAAYLSRMILTTNELILSAIIAVLVGSFAAYLFWAKSKFEQLEAQNEKSGQHSGLALAAYERLTLLTERLKLNNLAARLTQSDLSAKQLQQLMLAAMREEMDHNITQQLYVKKEIWDAVLKMKEQNSFIINQIAGTLPPEASSLDLSRLLVKFTLENPDATLNQLVLDALRHEAQGLL